MQPDIQNMENRETTEQSILKQLDMLTRIWQEKEVSRKGSLTLRFCNMSRIHYYNFSCSCIYAMNE